MKISSLNINKVLDNRVSQFSKNSPEKNILSDKVRELIELISISVVDSNSSRLYQQQIAEAFRKSALTQKKIAPFQMLDGDNNLSREELLEGLEKLLAENRIDSNIGNEQAKTGALQKGIMLILAVLLVVAGLAMIIMPAPPSFEIFTVYYFNSNDGVTVMDLFSLMIIFGGVLLLVLNFKKK
ncbi:hypothetical protein [Dyadobacter arcticus]|uniref:EF-hand domain-containing protein n=1 Tax=Dyadobacter arcticus TaxID=1078754 RepID=A0ABX0UKW9_9BACT|nr:hypothetical protein [Dyadobacter arcticus]NIJ53658.1 hypothetical protein [Dyadobacter arcticus]